MKHLDEFLEYAVNTRGFSSATANTYRCAIRDLAKTLEVDDPAKLEAKDLDLYMTRKSLAGIAASTRRSRGHAIKSFFRYLKKNGLIEKDPTAEFRPPEERGGSISTFTEDEVERMIFYRKPPAVRGPREPEPLFARRERVERLIALRDSALLGLAYCVGLRSGEVEKLRLDALTYDAKGACFISLFGKAAKEPKLAFVDRRVAGLLDEYLLARREAGIVHPALFCAIAPRPDAEPSDLGLNVAAVGHVFARRIADVKIQAKGRKLTPHAFRYTRATHLYEAGLPILEIRDFLRHRSIETTMRYIKLGSARSIERRANSKLPWNRPRGAATIPSSLIS